MNNKVKSKNKFKELYIQLCKYIDDTFHGKTELSKINWCVILVIASAIYYPIAVGEYYFDDIGIVITAETFFALFFIALVSCTLLFYKNKIILLVSVVLLLLRYVTLIDVGSEWNRQFNCVYLGVVVAFFVSLLSLNSAKKINYKGGKKDTLVLAIGLASLIAGILISTSAVAYYKALILIGFSLIYIYTISRVIYWILFAKERIKFNLIKVMGYIVAFAFMIIAIPFILEFAGVPSEIVRDIVVTIYTSIIGGIPALAGVAWTIKRNEIDKKENNHLLVKPFFVVIQETPQDLTKLSSKNFIKKDIVSGCVKFTCPIENTDKCEFCIDKIQVGDAYYYPKTETLIKKGEKFVISVIDEKSCELNKQTIKIFITDINYGQNVFDVFCSESGVYYKIEEIV